MLASDGPGKSILLDYLNASRTGTRSQTLSQVLAARGVSGKSLAAHVQQVQTSVLARNPEPPSGDHLIRFQDVPSEPAASRASQTPRVSLLKRIGSWLGF
jgi:hypothetical protein